MPTVGFHSAWTANPLALHHLSGVNGYKERLFIDMVNGAVSHDKITRFLSEREYTSKDLWLEVKSAVRQIEGEDGVLVFDDTMSEKRWTDENEVVCWHYDHTKGRLAKGINLLNALYHNGDVSIPVAFEVVKKPLRFCDVATRQLKRASLVTKSDLMRDMLAVCVANQLKFRYVLMDSWYAVRENVEFIVPVVNNIKPLSINGVILLPYFIFPFVKRPQIRTNRRRRRESRHEVMAISQFSRR